MDEHKHRRIKTRQKTDAIYPIFIVIVIAIAIPNKHKHHRSAKGCYSVPLLVGGGIHYSDHRPDHRQEKGNAFTSLCSSGLYRYLSMNLVCVSVAASA